MPVSPAGCTAWHGSVDWSGIAYESIPANIAYGRPGAAQSKIEAAARASRIHDFVMSLPDGYDAVVGERGRKLSGGHKQRMAIARMVLKGPPILIFD